MRFAALISQPMRIGHCSAYLRAHEGNHVIVTSDPASLDKSGFDSRITVLKASPPTELLPTAKLTRSRWFRRGLQKARSGSRFGSWLERTAKKVVWRLRYVDRAKILMQETRRSGPAGAVDVRTSATYTRLVEENQVDPFDRLIVFDLFDLPVALAFAEDHGAEVLVR